MVSSFDEGTLVTSYVRIPGSGTDTVAMPSMCDLSRVTTLVTPVSLQHSRGQNTTIKKISNMKKKNVPNELNRLRIENQQLRQENLLLRRKLSLLKQLIKDPERLKSVLNRLNNWCSLDVCTYCCRYL